jgi:hypothetical protein
MTRTMPLMSYFTRIKHGESEYIQTNLIKSQKNKTYIYPKWLYSMEKNLQNPNSDISQL